MPRQQNQPAGPLPVLLFRHGAVETQGLDVLESDPRLEVFESDELTAEWASFSQRVAGTFVIPADDPLDALVYAVSGGISPPIVMVVSRHQASQRDELVAAGASHCLVAPVQQRALNRVVAHLRSRAPVAQMEGALRLLLDPVARTARHHDKTVQLTQREYAVLHCMMSNHGRPVAAHQLVRYVWGNRTDGPRPRQILDVYVHRLRRKLTTLGLKRSIRTVHGIGYVLRHGMNDNLLVVLAGVFIGL